MQFHAASMDMTEEAMEQLRYGLSRSGPLQEALDHALKELDGCVSVRVRVSVRKTRGHIDPYSHPSPLPRHHAARAWHP